MKLEDWPDWDLVDEILDVESGLTEWEIRFAENCRLRLQSQKLSDGQRDKAIEIIRRLQSKG